MKPTSPAAVIGVNARRIRTAADLTLEQVAAAMRRFGLRWSTNRVGELEAGRVAPALSTLVVVALALSELTGRAIRIHDLVATDEAVAVTPTVTMTGGALGDFLRGSTDTPDFGRSESVPEPLLPDHARCDLPPSADPQAVAAVLATSTGSADRQAARALHISVATLAAHSLELWGRSLSDERDHRAGQTANRRQKGQVTRTLLAEITTYIDSLSRGSAGRQDPSTPSGGFATTDSG